MSTPPEVVSFARGLARLVKDTNIEFDAGGVDVALYHRSSGRYLGVVVVEDESVDIYVSTEDGRPELCISLDSQKEKPNESE